MNRRLPKPLMQVLSFLYKWIQPKVGIHYENTPIQIYRKIYLQKLKIFR